MAGPSKDFLLDPGTNGFIASPFSLMTTELNSLASTDTATSSVGGSSGVFSQSNFDNEIEYEVIFYCGGSITPTAGANLAGWWVKSPDGGSTFESTISNTAFPRPPDLLIPIDAAAITSSYFRFGIIAPCPWPYAKLFIQNNLGVTMASSGNIIKAAPVGWGY